MNPDINLLDNCHCDFISENRDTELDNGTKIIHNHTRPVI